MPASPDALAVVPHLHLLERPNVDGLHCELVGFASLKLILVGLRLGQLHGTRVVLDAVQPKEELRKIISGIVSLIMDALDVDVGVGAGVGYVACGDVDVVHGAG